MRDVFLHRVRLAVVSIIGTTMAISPAGAQYARFADFDDEAPGPIDDLGGWDSAGGDNRIITDPFDAANQVLYVPSSSSTLHRSLADEQLAVPDGTSRMLFLRLCVAEKQTFSFGLSHASSPREYSDFGPEIGMANSTQNLDLRVWDDEDGNYENVSQLSPNIWHNIWIRVDAGADTFRIWMNSMPGSEAHEDDILQDGTGDDLFAFRAGRESDLISFYIKTSGGSSGTNFGPIYIDDIFIELGDATNLSNPTTTPCPTDLNGDGLLDLGDISAFVTGFLAGDPVEDLSGDGLLDLEDVSRFVVLFPLGCP